MKTKDSCAIVLCTVLLLGTATSAAAGFKVIHTFRDKPAGGPCSTLIADSVGNFYGTACSGSGRGVGAVYELSPLSGGNWAYRVLHVFTGADGNTPQGKLLLDSAGNLYGTTYQGGSNNSGVVYELSPTSGGQWSTKTLYNFGGDSGGLCLGGLAEDAQGNLYGGTWRGGTYDEGVVFKLTPGSNGQWAYTTLYTFTVAGPQTGLVFDAAGNLYGGGEFGIFVLTPNSGGGWTESTAYTFTKADGDNPFGDLVFDAAGNLYSTNQAGGVNGGGTALKLTPSSGGTWTSTVMASFPSNSQDGISPFAGLSFDSAGNVYGTTISGGSFQRGVVFKLTPGAEGTWTESVVKSLTGGRNGSGPDAGVIVDNANNIFGTASSGGLQSCLNGAGCGIVFKIIP